MLRGERQGEVAVPCRDELPVPDEGQGQGAHRGRDGVQGQGVRLPLLQGEDEGAVPCPDEARGGERESRRRSLPQDRGEDEAPCQDALPGLQGEGPVAVPCRDEVPCQGEDAGPASVPFLPRRRHSHLQPSGEDAAPCQGGDAVPYPDEDQGGVPCQDEVRDEVRHSPLHHRSHPQDPGEDEVPCQDEDPV